MATTGCSGPSARNGTPGFVAPTVGLQAALSSRASVFAEYGYGFGLTRGAEGELDHADDAAASASGCGFASEGA